MITTDVELKPEKASLAVSTPVTKRMAIAPRNTKSARILVSNSTVNIASTVMIVIHAYRLNPHKTIDSISVSIYL